MRVNHIDEMLGVLETPYFWVFLNQLQRSVLLNSVQGKILSNEYLFTSSTTMQSGKKNIIIYSNYPISNGRQNPKRMLVRPDFTLFLNCNSFYSLPDFIPTQSIQGHINRDEGKYEWNIPRYWLVQTSHSLYIEGVDQNEIFHYGLKRILGGDGISAAD